jgi:RimJ/RimL family protein N-acetyltransferase
MAVELQPMSDALRPRVIAITPRPGQEEFTVGPAETLPAAEADPRRVPVVIAEDGDPVGFFVLHRAAPPLASAHDDVLLRAFLVDAAVQGRGIATRALQALPAFVRERLPGVRRVVLSVNLRNPVAIRTYLRAGFVDHGDVYLGGAAGPQHVLELAV